MLSLPLYFNISVNVKKLRIISRMIILRLNQLFNTSNSLLILRAYTLNDYNSTRYWF